MKKAIYIALSLITLIIGTYLGNFYALLHSEGTTHPKIANKLNILQSESSIAHNLADKMKRSTGGWQETNLRENLVRAVSGDNSIKKRVLIYQALSHSSQEELVPLINSIDSFDNISAKDKSLMLVMLLSRVAEISPKSSIELIIELKTKLELHIDQQKFLHNIFTIWSKNAPKEMFKYLLMEEQYQSDYLVLLFHHWAAKDYSQALIAVKKLQINSVAALYGMVHGSYTSSQYRQLLPIIWAEKDDDLQKIFFKQWAFIDALSVAEWLANNTKVSEAKNQKEEIFLGLIRADFSYAIDWYFANTNNSFSRPTFSNSNFYDFIPREQYSQVLNWLLLQDSASFKRGANWMRELEYNVSANAIKYDIDMVKRYLSHLTDISRKWRLSLMVYKVLAKQNTKNAKAFIVETGLANDARFMSQVEAIDLQLKTPCVGYCY